MQPAAASHTRGMAPGGSHSVCAYAGDTLRLGALANGDFFFDGPTNPTNLKCCSCSTCPITPSFRQCQRAPASPHCHSAPAHPPARPPPPGSPSAREPPAPPAPPPAPTSAAGALHVPTSPPPLGSLQPCNVGRGRHGRTRDAAAGGRVVRGLSPARRSALRQPGARQRPTADIPPRLAAMFPAKAAVAGMSLPRPRCCARAPPCGWDRRRAAHPPAAHALRSPAAPQPRCAVPARRLPAQPVGLCGACGCASGAPLRSEAASAAAPPLAPARVVWTRSTGDPIRCTRHPTAGHDRAAARAAAGKREGCGRRRGWGGASPTNPPCRGGLPLGTRRPTGTRPHATRPAGLLLRPRLLLCSPPSPRLPPLPAARLASG